MAAMATMQLMIWIKMGMPNFRTQNLQPLIRL
ncbi:hypothetical protein RJ641_011269 [Dillenia turbinata]|uniref:Uncharacterized protein n=1 Tax=Dillenia turbinata TaxID=194707 RepID=A0AAN8Z549_9MAGN